MSTMNWMTSDDARRHARRLVVILLLACAPALAIAQDRGAPHGVLVRIQGDITLGAEAREAAVVVVQGDASVAGTAGLVVVVQGTATLSGARVQDLVVVQGHARLDSGTVVTGDVQLVEATLTRGAGAVVEGAIHDDVGYRLGRGMLVFGLLFALGAALALLASGLVAAAVAPHGVRAVGAILTDELAATLVAVVLVWIALPIVAALLFPTIVGIPTALAVFFVVLPALGFLGYLIAGIRLGDYVLGRMRGHDEAWHPYLAAVTGLGLLMVLGWVPMLGSVVTPVAAFLGSGALAVHAWKTTRQPVKPPAEPSLA